jgi:collagenase-like PrtC family protease
MNASAEPSRFPPNRPRLSLGPLLYYWPREKVEDFYQRACGSEFDVVYLGEVVCSRRHELRLADWIAIGRMLREAGKEVVLSTQALLESESDLKTLRRIADNGEFAVEANDLGAVGLVAGKGPFVAGPHLNIYNRESLEWINGLGAMRWVMPVEISRDALAILQRGRPPGFETEVFACGRLPLAFSARCFTARHRNLPKDDCRFSCIDYPEGLELRTREAKSFLVLNGIQTQSAQVYNLVGALPEFASLGIDLVRISPHSETAFDIAGLFTRVLGGDLAPAEARRKMDAIMAGGSCDGYWHGRPGIESAGTVR